ncbi:MAG: TIGR02186 family protein, partial [Rhodobacteraceae bacterium]|nr:TIGR02186 family protein [Paracoccaceae bacterium]
MRYLAALLLCLLALPGRAEEVVLGLSKDKVAITATFQGSEILVFGAVKREVPIPQEPLDVVVAVAGPKEPVVVRRKERRFGIWINTDAVEVDEAPSFYAISTTGPLNEVLSSVEDLRHRVSIPRAIRSVGAPQGVTDAQSFTDAVIRIRKDNGAYTLQEGGVVLDEQTLFRTSIALPSNLTEGSYPTRIFLTRGGRVVSVFETTIDVRKVGLERWLYNMSREQPLL